MLDRLLALLILWGGAFAHWIWKRTGSTPEAESRERPLHDHERSDAHVLGVAMVLGGLGLFLILAALSPKLILPLVARETGRPLPAQMPFTPPPEPRLQNDPIADLARRRDAEMRRLEHGQDGSIPIEQAMAMVAGTIPVRSGPATPPLQKIGFDAVQSAEAVTSARYFGNTQLIANAPGNVPEGRP